MAYDQLKVDRDVERRTMEMKLENETEQVKKSQGKDADYYNLGLFQRHVSFE